MKNKKSVISIIMYIICILMTLILLTGCGKKENNNQNHNEKKSNGTMLDDKTLAKIENFEAEDNDDNWITILKPTHKKSINYPFKRFGLSALELGEGNCWTPNATINEINNVERYSTSSDTFTSYDELTKTKFTSVSPIYIISSAETYANGRGVHIIGDLCVYSYPYQETTIGDALNNGHWTVSSHNLNGKYFMFEDGENIRDTELYIRILKEWGMPSEAYYEYLSPDSNSVNAYMVYDCDGYDVWFKLYGGTKFLGMDIISVNFIGDGYFDLKTDRTFDNYRDEALNEYTKMP